MAKRSDCQRGWQKGVSFGSCGRLGAHAAGFEPGENGYLTYQTAGAVFMLIRPERQVIGSLQLPPGYEVQEQTRSWTLRVAGYKSPRRAGSPALDLRVLGSVVSPAITFASRTDRILRWRWQVRASPQWIIYATRGGAGIVHYSQGLQCPARRVSRPAASPGAGNGCGSGDPPPFQPRPAAPARWTGRWLVTFDPHSRNVPLLWVFVRPPTSVEVTTYEYLDFRFAQPFGRVWAMPLYGDAEIDREELARLAAGEGLRELARWVDFWAKTLPGLPDELDEYFRLDRAKGTLEVRDVGRRLDGKRPTVCPLPPFLSAALETRYPVKVANELLAPPRRPGRKTQSPDLLTHYGLYRVARRGQLRYTLPLCPYLDTVLAPMRVVNDARAEEMTRRLRAYFDDPKYTYGGDGTYDPDTLLDILHNLRVLAWAAWALPEDGRPAARAAIVRDFEKLFDEDSYRYYREPITGRRFCRDREVFGQFGNVTYDMDWYSGMNLAGLFAGVYFGAIPERLVARKWDLVTDIAAYFEIFQDWATLVPWTDMRGELLNLDCCRHGIQGMIGLARLARRLGKLDQAERAEYIASRYMVFLAAETVLIDQYQANGLTIPDRGKPGELTLGFGWLYERDSLPYKVCSNSKGPYTLSPLNPEHMLFLRDYGGSDKLQRYEAEVLDRELPGWDTRPAEVYFTRMRPDSIEHNAGAYHFYMVDPHLFLRMLVLDWPAEKAIGKVTELSGQVMATALVADAPKVLCPAGVEFAGATFDAAARVLTITGQAAKPMSATWRILWPAPPRHIDGPPGLRHHFADGKLTLAASCHGDIQWRLVYR